MPEKALIFEPLVSVIVPVYKTEAFLNCCLDCLTKQTLVNIEIILIDDASPDRCGKICDEHAKKDLRFKVFHNKINLGLSVVRNMGIAKACSRYLMFVDSDDWVHKDFCKDAYECAVRYQTDLVMFKHKCLGKTDRLGWIDEEGRFMHSDYITQTDAIDFLRIWGDYAWNKLYRKDLFNNICYPAGRLYEDIGTTYKLILKTSRIYYYDRVLYYHRVHKDSITALKTEESLYDLIEMSMQQYQDLATWGYPPNKLKYFLENIAINYCIKKKATITDDKYVFFANVLHNCKSVPNQFVLKRKVLFLLFKYCRPLFELVCELFDKKYEVNCNSKLQ